MSKKSDRLRDSALQVAISDHTTYPSTFLTYLYMRSNSRQPTRRFIMQTGRRLNCCILNFVARLFWRKLNNENFVRRADAPGVSMYDALKTEEGFGNIPDLRTNGTEILAIQRGEWENPSIL